MVRRHDRGGDTVRTRLQTAELELLDRRIVTIPATDWERFKAWMREPGKDVPALRDLAASRPPWAA